MQTPAFSAKSAHLFEAFVSEPSFPCKPPSFMQGLRTFRRGLHKRADAAVTELAKRIGIHFLAGQVVTEGLKRIKSRRAKQIRWSRSYPNGLKYTF